MSVPILREDLEAALQPWLGALFLTSNPLLSRLSDCLRAYAPYRQTLEELRGDVESMLLRGIHYYTHGSMVVLNDSFRSTRLTTEHIKWITDDVMGVLFDKLTPFSANFIKLNDYSLRVQSLSALRVLYQKYNSFYTPEELRFIVNMVKRIYPPAKYRSWLND